MWPDRVSNLGPLTYESGALPTALRGPDISRDAQHNFNSFYTGGLFHCYLLNESICQVYFVVFVLF